MHTLLHVLTALAVASLVVGIVAGWATLLVKLDGGERA